MASKLGVRLTGSPFAVTASVFDTEYRDFIESKVNLGVDPATGVTLFQSQNVAEARIYGAELDARVDASTWSRRLAGLDRATGRIVAAWRDRTRDVPLNSIDPPRLVLGVRYDAPSARWGSELAVTAVRRSVTSIAAGRTCTARMGMPRSTGWPTSASARG